MIDLSGTFPRWSTETVSLWESCAREAARDDRLWRFPAPQGDDLLRERLGQALGLDPAHLTITVSIRAAALTYARTSPGIVVERPTFPGVVQVLRSSPAEVVMRNWDVLLSERPPGRPLLWLTSPFRNPDGATLTVGDHAMLRARIEAGQHVVINAAYLWYAPETPGVPGADLIGSLHKLGGIGTRLGWVHSATYFTEAVPELLGATPSPVWQRMWGLFLERDGAALLRQDVVEPALASSAAFRDALPWKTGGTGPHGLLTLAPGIAEGRALRELEDAGFRVCAGGDFFCSRPSVRIAFLGVSPAGAERFAAAAATCGLFEPDQMTEAAS
jgi:DNA-binding transcriptional MocR family regulator